MVTEEQTDLKNLVYEGMRKYILEEVQKIRDENKVPPVDLMVLYYRIITVDALEAKNAEAPLPQTV